MNLKVAVKRAFSYVSAWVTTAGVALTGATHMVPTIKDNLPDNWSKWAIGAILLASIIEEIPRKGGSDASPPESH